MHGRDNGEIEGTAVVLSAGYFGFYAHAGFMLAMEELGIEYRAIAGSSAGAIVAAMHAAGMRAAEIIEALTGVRREALWDSTGIIGILRAVARRGRGWTGLLKGDQFEETLGALLPVKSFEECQRSLYVTALNLTRGAEETFHSGTIADKVRASCAYPFLMSAKNINSCHYWDGGFLSKVPIEVMLERERPSRVIIHYLPTREDETDLAERNWAAIGCLERALTVARKEIERHRLERLEGLDGKVIWVEPQVPRVGPNRLSAGRSAVEAAYLHAKSVLGPQGRLA
ncbi:MAG TPA: patatin-like phospholipase family protein [Blastocatellia bacterium]|jgi:NTE family protein